MRSDILKLWQIAWPSVIAQLGSQLLGMVDMWMVGPLGIDAIAATSLGGTWIWGTMVFSFGILLGADPILTQAHGAKDHIKVGRTLQQTIVLAILVSIPAGIMWWFTEDAMLLLGQSPVLAHLAGGYVRVQIPSLPLYLVYVALRQYQQAQSIVAPGMWVTLIANLSNALLDWGFIYGKWGMPALGVVGAGIATSITRGSLLLMLGLWAWQTRHQLESNMRWKKARLDAKEMWHIVKLGVPTAMQMVLESWAFQAATLISGYLGTAALAAHSLVLNMASFTFMVPLGVSMAVLTLVGNSVGAQNTNQARRFAGIGLTLAAVVQCVSAIGFLLWKDKLPLAYTHDPLTLSLSINVIPIVAAFQIFDGLQIVSSGALRGTGRTAFPAIAMFIGYYCVALPLGYLLAFKLNMGLVGLWWGLAGGLAMVSLVMIAWLYRILFSISQAHI